MKTCTKCAVSKELGEFHRDRHAHDGHRFWCKECAKADLRRFRTENPSYYPKACAEWRGKNPEYAANWYRQNLEHMKVMRSKWKQDNKGRIAIKNAAWREANRNKIRKQAR